MIVAMAKALIIGPKALQARVIKTLQAKWAGCIFPD